MSRIEEIIEEYRQYNEEEKEAKKYFEQTNKYLQTEVEKVIDAKTYLKEGMIMVRKHPRFCSVIPHAHNYLEVNFMLSGEVSEIIDDNKIVLKKGEMVFFSKKSKHSILPAKEDDILLNFLILPEFFDFIIPYIDENGAIKNFLMDLLSSESEANSIIFHVSDNQKIQNIVQNILISFSNNDKEMNNILRYYFMILMFELIKCTNEMEETLTASYDSVLIFKTFNYIENNYVNGSLKGLAILLNEDYNYLSKRIKKITSFSFQKLLEMERIKVSKTLLNSTDININDIANHIGYDNLTFFYKLFKKYEGITPLKYRNNNKK